MASTGPGTVFYIKSTGTYQPVAPFYYVPFSGLQTTPTGLRREIPMELWCYIGRASSGTVCLALTDTKQWVLFYCPGHLCCGRVCIGSRKLARLPIQYFCELFSLSALKRTNFHTVYKGSQLFSSFADCLFWCCRI